MCPSILEITRDDILVGTFDNASALAPGGQEGDMYMTETDSVPIPKRFRGTVYVIVVTDADDQVDEWPRDENNTIIKPVFVEPLPFADLVASDVVVPTQVVEGSEIEVRYTRSRI